MKSLRHSYQVYKDERDCLTKKIINRSMYILLNAKMRPVVQSDGKLLIFYKKKQATRFVFENKPKEQDWRIKKIRLDITML